MFKSFAYLSLLVALSFACSQSGVFATPTPVPSATPSPTQTPVPTPVPTPKPALIPGVNTPIRYIDVSFQVNHVESASSWIYKGETYYPFNPGDMYLAIYFDITDGDIYKLPFPPADTDVMSNFHISDNKGNVDKLSYPEANEEGTKLLLLFQVNPAASNFIFSFPNGQEIDLAPFLDR